MQPRLLLDSARLALTIDRLCHQLIEQHRNFQDTCLIGVQPRGVALAERIHARLSKILKTQKIDFGKLDITFHRDDFRQQGKPLTAHETSINFEVENRNVVLIDDVLFTGRTIRAALDALLAFGRPKDVELLVLIDRRLQRHVPIQAKYVGKIVDSITTEKVKVEWKETDGEDKVWVMNEGL